MRSGMVREAREKSGAKNKHKTLKLKHLAFHSMSGERNLVSLSPKAWELNFVLLGEPPASEAPGQSKRSPPSQFSRTSQVLVTVEAAMSCNV